MLVKGENAGRLRREAGKWDFSWEPRKRKREKQKRNNKKKKNEGEKTGALARPYR